MKIVKVTYTVNADFTETNMQNVRTFMKDVEALNNPALRYISYLGEDGKTFTHIATYNNDSAQQQFLALESFKSFQQQRNARLEGKENIEMMNIVAASYPIF